jgi:tetratricopeptide (TPR) repeat protein
MTDPLDDRRRRVQGAILLHGTSPAREEAARFLARLVLESGAAGAALGRIGDRRYGRLAPAIAISVGADTSWDATLPGTFVRPVGHDASSSWYLMLRSVNAEGIARVASAVESAGRMLGRGGDPGHRPPITLPVDRPFGRFLSALDAYRMSGFARASRVLPYRQAVARALDGSSKGAARSIVRALSGRVSLASALADLAHELEDDHHLPEAAAAYVILYELALLEQDSAGCMDAARWAGRAFRKAADWQNATRWYELSRRVAEHRGDFLRLVRVLDGLGNTHRERGSFPKARQYYRDAWKVAQVAGSPVEIANVALGFMTVEREAGRLAAAAAFGWTALGLQTDPMERANLLLNIGTLLRDGGDLEAAERAYRVSAALTGSTDVRLLAADALAYCAALRGDARSYRRLRPRAGRTTPYVRVQMGYFRGAALRALGDARASRVLRAAERYARAHGLAEWEVKSAALREKPLPRSLRVVETPAHVARGLRELEAALA